MSKSKTNQLAATMRGVWPSESASSTFAPMEMSAWMARSSPSSAAWCKGEAASYCEERGDEKRRREEEA